jgi:sugar transferase (PEP-CTERM/EpsH1 system associated)
LWVKSGGLLPLDTGGKIRSFNLVRELARNHEVTVFTFYGSHPNDSHAQLKQHFHQAVCLPIQLPEPRGVAEALDYARNLFSFRPYTLAKYCRPLVTQRLLELVRKENFDIILCDFLFSADVIPWHWPCPKVLFTHNVEEQIWRRHFEVTRNPIWKAVSWREYRTMRSAERHYVRLADHVLAVSENDRSYFAAYAEPEKITVIPTGVDTDYFQPAAEAARNETMVFTGSMDWLPNEDAIEYFAESILPRVRAEIPTATLRVVGRRPSQRLRALVSHTPGLEMVGEVPDIRPHVHNASIFIVPLRIGGGTRIKIFEAMAMGRVVVSTAVGAEGLPVRHNENIILADKPEDFARQAVELLRNSLLRTRISRAARALVEENYSWRSVARVFDTVFQRVVANRPQTDDSKPSVEGRHEPADIRS